MELATRSSGEMNGEFNVNGSAQSSGGEQLFVKHRKMLIRLRPPDILWIEASDNCSFIFTRTEKILVSETLKMLMNKLESTGMIRVHRSFAVNIDRISALTESALLIGKKRIPIGRTHRKELMEKITML